MKRLLLCLFALLSLALLGATDVSGNQSGIWTLAASPYQVIGAITVPAGSNLAIQPGVVVHITGSFQITVAGTMTAGGTVADSIRFIKDNPATLWPGLRLENTSQQSSLQHVYVEYATYGIRSMNSPMNITGCRLNYCEKGMNIYAIGATGNPATVLVQNCLIENSVQNGILINQNSNALIQNNEIRYNGTGTQFYGAIQLANQSANGSNNPTISGNHIHHNHKQGITAWDVASAGAINPQILNNVIEYNYTGIYLLQTSGYVADNQINYNFIPGDMNSGAGVMVSGVTSHPFFERNTVMGNYTGFYITNNSMPVLGDMVIDHVWAQGENVIRDNIDANGILHSVYCDAYANATNIIKAENNDWGVYTLDEIAVGVNDHTDNAALPTVDYDPFISPVLPTSVTGSYEYQGSYGIQSAALELIGTSTGEVLFSFPLPQTSFSVSAPLQDTFYAQVVLTRNDGQSLLYGVAGGYLNPGIFAPGDFSPVDVGNITVTDNPLPRYELMGEAYPENDLVLHPLMSGFGVYGWRKINWVYAVGDYLYLKRHWIKGTPNIVVDLPDNTMWSKYQNINNGDSWQHTEVMDAGGTLRTSTVSVQDCSTFPGIPAFRLTTRKDAQNVVLDKTISSAEFNTIYRYEAGFTAHKDNILRFGEADPLAAGAIWVYDPAPMEYNPNNLGFDPTWQDETPAPWDVRLFWQAPALGQYTWTHYHIYRNNELLAEIPFAQSEYTDPTFDFAVTGTTYYEVKAWDGSIESPASNFVTVIIVSNDDALVQPISFRIGPNPVAVSRHQTLQIKASDLGQRQADIAIYNLKGQKVLQTTLTGEAPYAWQGLDSHGKRCATGIYFMRINVPGEKELLRKLVLK